MVLLSIDTVSDLLNTDLLNTERILDQVVCFVGTLYVEHFFFCLQRLYRETYHKNKDKIHTTPDTPEIRQVKTNQESISDVCLSHSVKHIPEIFDMKKA